ncbi:uncharacterized protein LOC105275148 [Ooceraea biroi]|uniref:uncharacterized protein LOC105275148 n=1 Tax=Ooceraea biroi TaxID=2015173 RepID=UPI0005BDD579|nr:uncharacterized protein LOC105275148 [Ooceraea biroi]
MTVSISSSSDVNLDEALQRFWQQEKVPALPRARLTAEELECVNHFRSTHSRDNTRRYIVRLPFRAGCGELGSSRSAALRLLERMQHQIRRDAIFGQLYVAFMKEYEALGHMTHSSTSSSTGANFLPHHGVLRQNSSTTKLRVVFNGSARTSSGLSLNDCLHVGPKLHQDIDAVLLRWRVHAFVFAADIEKMFRQILLHADDQHFQKILWSASGTPLEYFLGTLTYGLVSSPYQSIQTLLQLADDEEHRFPLAANVLRFDFYVDDVLLGDDTPQRAHEKVHQLTNLLKAGGFKLQKWSTNESSILEDIVVPAPSSSSTREFDAETRMLGLTWHPSSDTFHFRVSQSDSSVTPTKRIVLSRVSQLFDPLGWLSPVTILGKIFIQSLWKAQVGWDEPLSPSLSLQWMEFSRELCNVQAYAIPRWLHTRSDSQTLELHGFSDASQNALGAVIFLRTFSDIDDVKVTLVAAKSKVAPLKKQTIPRLELSAAVLFVRLLARIRSILKYHHVPAHLWVDSSVCLAWIRGCPFQWQEFVANRVAVIQELAPDARWHHVIGTENPADCASRGLLPRLLAHHQLW